MRSRKNIAGNKKASKILFEKISVREEIPNDDLLDAMEAADRYLKGGKRKVFRSVKEAMAALE